MITKSRGKNGKARLLDFENDEKVLTLHPEGKQGVNILKRRYEQVKEAITDVLLDNNEVTFSELTEQVNNRIARSFDGAVPWYVTTVKLDLEARGIIRRVPESTPQRLSLS